MSKDDNFTRRVPLDSITNKPRHEVFKASPKQCVALAERFNLQELSDFEIEATLTREKGGRVIHITGNLSANVVQTCVVTLEPVPSRVKAEFDVFYSEEDIGAPEDETIMQGDEAWPERLTEDALDIAELAAQFLSLELDPYPRLPGAGLQDAENAGETQNPFAKLKEIAANREE